MVRDYKEADELLQKVAALLEAAIANGDTLTAISQRTGIPQPRLSQIKRRTGSKPNLATVQTIAETLGYRVVFDVRKS